jgi:hypothetical protein
MPEKIEEVKALCGTECKKLTIRINGREASAIMPMPFGKSLSPNQHKMLRGFILRESI